MSPTKEVAKSRLFLVEEMMNIQAQLLYWKIKVDTPSHRVYNRIHECVVYKCIHVMEVAK